VQAVPFKVKELGLPVLPVWVAWKPMLWLPPPALMTLL
jgi:hypothetical protein